MPSVSASQQRLFGMVHAYQKGKLKHAPEKVREVAKHISKDDATHFAETKHEGLPEKVALFLEEFSKAAGVLGTVGRVGKYLGINALGAGAEAFDNKTDANHLGGLLHVKPEAFNNDTYFGQVYNNLRQPAIQGAVDGATMGPEAIPGGIIFGSLGNVADIGKDSWQAGRDFYDAAKGNQNLQSMQQQLTEKKNFIGPTLPPRLMRMLPGQPGYHAPQAPQTPGFDWSKMNWKPLLAGAGVGLGVGGLLGLSNWMHQHNKPKSQPMVA